MGGGRDAVVDRPVKAEEHGDDDEYANAPPHAGDVQHQAEEYAQGWQEDEREPDDELTSAGEDDHHIVASSGWSVLVEKRS
jgi:hypothetical protein